MGAKSTDFELKTWDDVDKCLREIAECELTLGNIETDLNMTINEAKERAAKLAKPLQARVKALTALVKAFAEESKGDMDGKSKQLNFGRVGFRQSSSVNIPVKKIAAIIKNLKEFGMGHCVTVKEFVDKEALEKHSDVDIAKIGASRKVEDKFFLETDKTKVAG